MVLLLLLSLPEREGGGGAPTFFCGRDFVGCAEKSRAGAGDRPGVGTVGLGCSGGVPRRGTPCYFFLGNVEVCDVFLQFYR